MNYGKQRLYYRGLLTHAEYDQLNIKDLPVITLDEKKYRKLVSRVLPKKIETEEEYQRFLETLAALSFPERRLPPEEDALSDLLEQLIIEYENRTVKMPDASPLKCLEFLIEQNGLAASRPNQRVRNSVGSVGSAERKAANQQNACIAVGRALRRWRRCVSVDKGKLLWMRDDLIHTIPAIF